MSQLVHLESLSSEFLDREILDAADKIMALQKDGHPVSDQLLERYARLYDELSLRDHRKFFEDFGANIKAARAAGDIVELQMHMPPLGCQHHMSDASKRQNHITRTLAAACRVWNVYLMPITS